MPLASIFPAIADCLPALHLTCQRYAINTVNRQAAFVSQCGWESQGFARFSENLNYSQQGLLATFPTHFTPAQAAIYARKPQAIANRVYAGRLGNGDEASGDGWRFAGKGAIQITGRANYQALANALGKTLDETVDYLKTDEGAMVSAGWFWSTHNLNPLADAGNMLQITRVINGGLSHLQDRCALYGKVRLVLLSDGVL